VAKSAKGSSTTSIASIGSGVRIDRCDSMTARPLCSVDWGYYPSRRDVPIATFCTAEKIAGLCADHQDLPCADKHGGK
jgi:hypothetical protein